ncbi:HdeD family acid-resistance protein [Alsobacter sp. SYSU M60028]|uniref:HdeD family acid-resistance protein n=1 Tax=Alsobacter ponti TaxID=2962936 RepID=A0ABT1LDM5_9HYPH|nr:HdeD family acid-resistance protein [Alsobacter ponti]MCP8939036.1 HdeD family acid-resistance protein [Alsobacter ponti]
MTNAAPVSAIGLGNGIGTLRAKWGWLVALGVLMALCGLFALGNAVLATFTVVIFAGAAMIVSGIGEIIHGFAVKTWSKFFLWVLVGLLYVVAGIVTVSMPLVSAVVLTLFVGAALIASGIVHIVLAFQMKEGAPWGWVALSGVVTLLLGVMILAGWPVSGLTVLGVFLGIDLLFTGASWIAVGLALRKAG